VGALGQRLKELRGPLSLVSVERGTGIARIDLSRYEQGRYYPSPDRLKRIAEFYEVPYKDLRMLYYEDFYKDPEELQIIIEWAKQK
jgi:transcriptional regulator with XRE-family HTH domain